ncbi:MAG TPA: hypothetical protein VF376_00330 [Thermoanaerobaculia bacterium]
MRLDRGRIFWLAAAMGLLIRIALFLVASEDPERRMYAPDSFDYQRLAVNLIESHAFSRDSSAPYRPDILRTPAYPALLAVLYSFAGLRPALGVFAGVLLSVASIFLARRAAQTWAPGARVGEVAGAFVALDLGAAAYANYLLTEAFFTFLLLLAFDLLGRAMRPASAGRAIAAGAVLGVAILCRPIAVALPLAVLATRNGRVIRFLLLGSFVVVAPWVARNAISAGFFGVSSVGSVNLLYHRASAVEDASLGRPHETAATPSDASDRDAVARMRRQGLEVLRQHAGWLIRLTLYAWLRTFGPDEDPIFGLFGIRTDPSPWWLTRSAASHQPMAPSLTENLVEGGFLLLLAVCVARGLGAWKDPRLRPLVGASLGVIVYFLLASGPEYYGRFRVPILPFLALIGDAGTVRSRVELKPS